MTAPALRLTGGRLSLPTGPASGDLVLHAGRIHAVGESAAAAELVLDVSGLVVAPGFVDLQVNGGHGIDLTSQLVTRPELLWELARHLPHQGVTAFVPTIVSSPPDAVHAALAALRAAPQDHLGAIPLGVHAEGPMLAPTKRGTHDPARLRSAEVSRIDGWSRDAGLVMATVAPELPGALVVIEELVRRGVIVSIGHTDATYEQGRAALVAGARAGTHLGNAMSGFTAREPGVIGALLADPRAIVGLIVDGVHLHPGTITAVWQAIGPERIALVTDAIAAAGTADGTAMLAGRPVTIAHGVVRDAEGALAGSVVTMDRALRGLLAATGADPFGALRAATATPAGLLGDRERGCLVAGARADVVVLTPDLEVVATFVGGHLAAHPMPARLPLPDSLAVRAIGAPAPSRR